MNYWRLIQMAVGLAISGIFMVIHTSVLDSTLIFLGGVVFTMGFMGGAVDRHKRRAADQHTRAHCADIVGIAFAKVIADNSLRDEAMETIETVHDDVAEATEWAERDPVAHRVLYDSTSDMVESEQDVLQNSPNDD